MSSWRSFDIDEMAWFACAEEEPPLPKEKGRRRAMSVVNFAIVGCGLPSAGGASRLVAIVGIAADDDGIVPGRPSGGAIVGVAVDDGGVVPVRPSRGAIVGVAVDDGGVVPGHPGVRTPQSPAWCSLL